MAKGPKMAQPVPLASGPWNSVLAVAEAPAEMAASTLYDAENFYFPAGAASCAIRPAFTQISAVASLGSVAGRYGQAIYEHVGTDATRTTFVFCGGKVYRWNGATTLTDVTPVGVSISATGRVFCASLGDQLVVTDSTNRPWIMGGLQSTPVTGTYIDYDGLGTAWTAWGAPVIYAAKVFFICNILNGVSARNAIMWSEEAAASVGYQQAGYDNLWELTQSDTDALYALAATNAALYYFRARSIGLIAGQVDSTFQTTATHDSVSLTVGTTTPASVAFGGRYIYFLDERGFPYRLTPGGEPEPVWEQARDHIRQITGGTVPNHTWNGVSAYNPDLGHVLMGIAGIGTGADTLLVFDADSGKYQGRWSIGSRWVFDTLATVRDSSGNISVGALVNSSVSGGTETGGSMVRLRTLGEYAQGAVTLDSDFTTSTRAIVPHYFGRVATGVSFDFHRVRLRVMTNAGGQTSTQRQVTLRAIDPHSGATASTLTALTTQPGTALTNYGSSGYVGEALVEWGINKSGRWLQLSIAPYSSLPVTSRADNFMPLGIVVDAVPTSAASGIR